jgi:hypothetical protein
VFDGTTFLVGDGHSWTTPDPVGYPLEAELEQHIADSPEALLPGVAPGSVAVSQFSTPAGPIDVLVVDPEGRLTLVECKRHANAQARREIVGQALDYASRLTGMTLEQFHTNWARAQVGTSGTAGADLSLSDTAQETLTTALATGRIRVVLALDDLNADLCRIVDYLNQHTTDDLTVLALQLRRLRHGELQMIVPRLHGVEAAERKERTAPTTAQAWTTETADDWFRQHRPEHMDLAHRLFKAAADHGLDAEWTASATPSFVIRVRSAAGASWPLRAQFSPDGGVLQIAFRWLIAFDADHRDRFLDVVSRIPELELDAGDIRAHNYRRQPNRPLSVLADGQVRDALFEALALLRDTQLPHARPAREPSSDPTSLAGSTYP